jgi:hypothetical protein
MRVVTAAARVNEGGSDSLMIFLNKWRERNWFSNEGKNLFLSLSHERERVAQYGVPSFIYMRGDSITINNYYY